MQLLASSSFHRSFELSSWSLVKPTGRQWDFRRTQATCRSLGLDFGHEREWLERDFGEGTKSHCYPLAGRGGGAG